MTGAAFRHGHFSRMSLAVARWNRRRAFHDVGRGRSADRAGMGSVAPADVEEALAAITRNDAVPTIIEVVCRTTGMRFAAVARVTEDRWIACAVRDDIEFRARAGWRIEGRNHDLSRNPGQRPNRGHR